MAAVYRVAQRLDAKLGIVVQPHGAPFLAVDHGGLLARPQIGDGLVAFGGGDAIGDAAAIAAAIKPEHQTWLLRRAAMHEGINAERAMGADQAGAAALLEFE